MSYEVYCIFLDEPLLIIPINHGSKISTKPLKWIRYATAAVLGSEGDLIRYTEDEDCGEDLTLDMEDEKPCQHKLIFRPTSPIRFIDKDVSHTSSSQLTEWTESPTRFRDQVVQRDGLSVIPEIPEPGDHPDTADASHIIPYAQGSEYIQAVCKWRNCSEHPEIEDIDDVRNGILLNLRSHSRLSLGTLGVLHTPNFALSVNEVLPLPGPNKNTAFRFTAQYFPPGKPPDEKEDIRYPIVVIDGWPVNWPPAFLWMFNYGVVIAKRYGNQVAMNILAVKVNSHYELRGQRVRDQFRAEIQSHRNERMEEQLGRAAGGSIIEHRKGCPDQKNYFNAMDNVLRLSINFGSHPVGTAVDQQRERGQHGRAADKINAWRKVVEDSGAQSE